MPPPMWLTDIPKNFKLVEGGEKKMGSKTYLIIGGVIIALILGYVTFKGNLSPTNSVPVPTTAENTPVVSNPTEEKVEYNDTGFTPESITVKKGTSVTWINKSQKPMWVASAIHPTHRELPGFDQLESVGNDSEYSYTFDKIGNWKYHNHVSPSDFGSVVVE